jgi:hypothetical protein
VAEQITAQREHNGEDENPHQPEETEAEHEKGQLTHAETPGSIRKTSCVPPI